MAHISGDGPAPRLGGRRDLPKPAGQLPRQGEVHTPGSSARGFPGHSADSLGLGSALMVYDLGSE